MKPRLESLAILAAFAIAWSKLGIGAVDLENIITPPFKPTCKNGERLSWDSSARRWVCVPIL